jgi:hypothetical protein
MFTPLGTRACTRAADDLDAGADSLCDQADGGFTGHTRGETFSFPAARRFGNICAKRSIATSTRANAGRKARERGTLARRTIASISALLMLCGILRQSSIDIIESPLPFQAL